jgi:hypothetical protein
MSEKSEQLIKLLISALVHEDLQGSQKVLNEMTDYVFQEHPEFASSFCTPECTYKTVKNIPGDDY